MDSQYQRKNFKEGSVLKATDMRDIEDAIVATEEELELKLNASQSMTDAEIQSIIDEVNAESTQNNP